MILTHLELTNFRSYTKSKFTFSPSVTIIVGGNASGKTNILEAVFLMSTGRSFRAEKDTQMLEFGKEVGRVKGEIIKLSLPDRQAGNNPINTNNPINKSENIDLGVILTNGIVMGVKTPIKKYQYNGVAKRMLDFVGNLRVVLFWPQDLELVTDSPSLRRRYLDFVLMQTDKEYRRNLISYERGIRQRNKVLEAIREQGAHRHQLIFWDQLLIKAGEYITKKREEYINYVNKYQISPPKADQPRAENLKFQINDKLQLSNYQLIYDNSVISRQRLDQYSEEEVAAGVTLVGPHRDDLIFQTTDNKEQTTENKWRDLASFGSRGEQRLGILWLKMGELAYIEEITGEKPVLLLDDILSELDHEHRKIIFEIIGNQQTIMTTTDEHLIEKASFKEVKLVKL